MSQTTTITTTLLVKSELLYLDTKYSWTSLSLSLTFFRQYFQETAISMSKCIPKGIAKLMPACISNEKLRRALRLERLSLKTGRILLLRPLRHARLRSPIHPNHSHMCTVRPVHFIRDISDNSLGDGEKRVISPERCCLMCEAITVIWGFLHAYSCCIEYL